MSILNFNFKNDPITLIAKQDISELRSPEGWLYASKGRYECFFGRDSIISSLELLKYDPTIAQKTLLHLKKTQGKEFNILREEEKGKIVHEERLIKDESYMELIRQGFDFPYYGSADSTLLYLFLAEEYIKTTGDKATILEIGESFLEALKWVYSKQDNLLFIRIKSLNSNGEVAYKMVNMNWIDSPNSLSYKDGSLPIEDPSLYPVAHLEVQALLYRVISNIALIQSYLPKEATSLIEHFQTTNTELQKNIISYFYMNDISYFAPAIDAKNRQFDIVTSIPGYLLYLNVVDTHYANLIKEKLFSADMCTKYGIRVLASNEKRFDPLSYQQGAIWPHDNWIIYTGLINYRFKNEAKYIKQAIFKAIEPLGNIPEFFNVSIDGNLIRNDEAMKIQAWSCGAIIALDKYSMKKSKTRFMITAQASQRTNLK